jgi:hypothetical protein
MSSYNIINIFPTSLIQIEFDNHHNYIFEDIDKSVNKPDGWEMPLNCSFPHIRDDDPFISPIVRDNLIIDLTKCIKKVFRELDIPDLIYIDDFWYNIYHDNQGQEIHDHLADSGIQIPFWSGIYYNKNSSSTCFIRSDRMFKTQYFKNCTESAISEAFDAKYCPEVKDGDIILFPSHLEHSIRSEDWHTTSMRLTFAFNINLFGFPG